jgi:hypothetical protein
MNKYMKKLCFILMMSIVCMTSCDTYTGQGAYVGSTFGSIIGSAIGGITGGPRGSDVGTLIGMAGGAVAGAAIGSAVDNQQNGSYQPNRDSDYGNVRGRRYSQQREYAGGNSNGADINVQQNAGNKVDDEYTPNDDRINMYNGDDYTGNYSAANTHVYDPDSAKSSAGFTYQPTNAVEIVNLRVVDANRDNMINAGEEGKIIFEVMNRSNSIIYDIYPNVIEVTGNRHIILSPGLRVESIQPGKGIRYTAMLKATSRLKNGEAVFQVSVIQGTNKVISKICELKVQTTSMIR